MLPQKPVSKNICLTSMEQVINRDLMATHSLSGKKSPALISLKKRFSAENGVRKDKDE
ncbi:hypothetical protein DAPPUDRAFT_249797 [Daphnia pulex]|uniref:Uncharacterized protein n=1 Tax=Daphnia pulex TaxID=6669 RepID=E9GXB4_DAPPU|nr:hypothetical protein DAPPUDRAFT_249797 [Daphnia pulex]|eukprot:EFX75844.1 hypothetical protein DAPPUDRAFT_249797 [Daphnia pulex]